MRLIRKILGKVVFIVITLVVICGISAMTINNHVVNKGKDALAGAINETTASFSKEEIEKMKDFDGDAIVILGAGIQDDDTPSPMLKDRLDAGFSCIKTVWHRRFCYLETTERKPITRFTLC